MKLVIALMAVALTGCAGLDLVGAGPLVDVLETAVGKDEPTIRSGMTSRDAAYSSQYRAYVNAHKQGEQKPLLKLVAVPGKAIENLASVEVYAPSTVAQGKIEAPVQPKAPVVELIDSMANVAERVGRSVMLPWLLSQDNKEIALKQLETSVANEQIRSDERRDLTGQAIDAASKDPLIVTPLIVR